VQRRRLEVDTLKWTFTRQQPKGIRNKAEDTAQGNAIVLSWSNSADDVSAREVDEDSSAPVLNLVDKAS
jgi:hypothetical protein